MSAKGGRRPHLVVAASLLIVASVAPTTSTRSVSAAVRPSATWTVSALRSSSAIKTSTLLTTNSNGAQSWSVRGSCSLAGREIRTRTTGTCNVTVTIRATALYSSLTVRRSFSIVPSPPVPERFDPYAGVKASVAATGTKSEGSLRTSDGRTRRYRTYVPTGLRAGTTVPLVIALHGGLGTSSQFAANSGLDGFAEANKFIAVYPDGIGNQPDGTGFQTWNGGYCCGPAATNAVDDVSFIRSLVSELRRTLPIDASRVYAMGHSNGGILSYKLACELSDVVVAIGVQAGSNVVAGCRPARPVSVFHLHGTADTNMPIDGGKGSGLSATVFVSARSSVEAMASVNGLSVSTPTPMVTSNADVTALSWRSRSSSTEVRFVTVRGATHAWMGHPAQSAGSSSYVGIPYMGLDATRTILSFVLSKSR